MPVKAVHASQSLAVYISGEDYQALLAGFELRSPVFIGKRLVGYNACSISLSDKARVALQHQTHIEQNEVQKARKAMRQANPDFRSKQKRRGK